MKKTDRLTYRVSALTSVSLVAAIVGFVMPGTLSSQTPAPPDVTFTKDIAPILQRSCQQCHRPVDGVAPMALVTYDDARPWAKSMKARTSLRSQRGAMPPLFVEKNIGIQKFKHDPYLCDEEIAKIAKW